VLEVVYTEKRMRFTPEHAAFFERLSATASVALEQAREFERDHQVAETLQEALLIMPSEVPGIEFAHAYHSASDATRVGGDFYDLFELDNGLIGLTVGDISGKGLNAAALTSLVKNTIRARATEKGTTPADAVALADRVLFHGSSPEIFATIWFAMLDRRDGRLLYCNAGHPSAAIVRTDGAAVPLGPTSPIVGAIPDLSFRDAETRLDPGDVLFLYTDGLTEARKGGELYGEERLFAALEGAGGMTPVEVLRRMREEVVDFAGPRLADDLAVLALRRLGSEWGAATRLRIDVA
jgi:sigma-B regulation protein RsbU (phosphoserine phosphatase)